MAVPSIVAEPMLSHVTTLTDLIGEVSQGLTNVSYMPFYRSEMRRTLIPIIGVT
jgi:hypothetical protein